MQGDAVHRARWRARHESRARHVKRIGSTARLGGIGGAVAGLLVLVLLALAALPALARAPAPGDHGRSAALGRGVYDHGSHDHDSHGADATPARHGHDGEAPAGEHRGTHPTLACCVAMHCPMLTGSLPGAPVQPSPPAGSPPSEAAMPRRLAGLSVSPALPPPRAVAA